MHLQRSELAVELQPHTNWQQQAHNARPDWRCRSRNKINPDLLARSQTAARQDGFPLVQLFRRQTFGASVIGYAAINGVRCSDLTPPALLLFCNCDVAHHLLVLDTGGLTVAIGETQYAAQPYGFAYEGKLSESLISGGIVMGPNGFSPQQGSKTIIELLPMELDKWLTQDTNIALRREIFSADKVETETVLAFLIAPGAGNRMLLGGPQAKTVVVALLFNGAPADFDTPYCAEDLHLDLRSDRFDRLMDADSDWWSS